MVQDTSDGSFSSIYRCLPILQCPFLCIPLLYLLPTYQCYACDRYLSPAANPFQPPPIQPNLAHRETLKTTKPYSGRKRSLAGQKKMKKNRRTEEKKKRKTKNVWFRSMVPTVLPSHFRQPPANLPPTSHYRPLSCCCFYYYSYYLSTHVLHITLRLQSPAPNS